MKRPGTRKSYTRLLDNIRARIPNVALRTTFIVGFPGETADDFAELEAFIAEVGFDHVGVFTYSHEEGTSAHDLADDVPAATKKKRQDRLMARQRDLVAARQQARLGERTRLVVDGRSPEHELVVQGPAARPGPGHRPGGLPDRLRPLRVPERRLHRRGNRRFAGLRPHRPAALKPRLDRLALKPRRPVLAVARRRRRTCYTVRSVTSLGNQSGPVL